MIEFEQQPQFNAVSPTVSLDSQETISTLTLGKNDELLEMGDTFNLDDFQVVRREFFAHINEPSITFNNYKFYVNTACLTKFPYAKYMEVLVDSEKKILALKPCQEWVRDSFLWCRVNKHGKREPKQTSCKVFFAMVADLMGWSPQHRYKLLGKLIHANGEYLLAFDLTATQVYKREYPDGAKPVTSRTPIFPAEWKGQFGMPFYEHQQSLKINTFDGFAVYAIKDKTKSQPAPQTTEAEDAP